MSTTNEYTPELTAVMRMMSTDGYKKALSASGVPMPSLYKAYGADCWLNSDRTTVRYALDAGIFAILDFAGLPRLNVSAEFLAAFAVISVAPSNWMAFSHFYANATSVSEFINQDDNPDVNNQVFKTGISSERLFALITKYASLANVSEVESMKADIASVLKLSE